MFCLTVGDDSGQSEIDCHAHNLNAKMSQEKSSCVQGKVDVDFTDWEKVEPPPAVQFKRLTKDALASAINQAATARVRRESSGEREGESACECVCVLRGR